MKPAKGTFIFKMKVRINGEEKEIEDGMTLKGLLDGLEIKLQGIAVDINKEIVPKSRFGETFIRQNDCIEIVRMAGGG